MFDPEDPFSITDLRPTAYTVLADVTGVRCLPKDILMQNGREKEGKQGGIKVAQKQNEHSLKRKKQQQRKTGACMHLYVCVCVHVHALVRCDVGENVRAYVCARARSYLCVSVKWR